MKKQFLSMAVIAGLAIGAISCGNDSTTADDTTTTTNTTTADTETTMTTSSGDYAAMADSVERNSQQGYYLNPRTGEPYKNLRVDRTSGQVTTEAGEPVWRYVDNRSWSVYGYDDSAHSWNQMGEARMQGKDLQYKGDGDKWSNYQTRWGTEDERMSKEWKIKSGDTKIKKDEDGDLKIKTDDQKIKVDKDGEVKQKDN